MRPCSSGGSVFFERLADGLLGHLEQARGRLDGQAFLRKARSICCSFSGVVLRELDTGVKVLLQSLQRQRLLPLSLVPKRITGSAW